MKVAIHWFRRDLRLEDNYALSEAIKSGKKVLPIFIFDEIIINELPQNDARISFIYKQLKAIDDTLKKHNSSLLVLKSKPLTCFKELIETYSIDTVYTNEDFEPYAIARDNEINSLLSSHNISFKQYKDHVIFSKFDVLKDDGLPYTIYTPYKNKWLTRFNKKEHTIAYKTSNENYLPITLKFPTIEAIGFKQSDIEVLDYNINDLSQYTTTRDFPSANNTSFLGPHLRFGTISIREVIRQLKENDVVFLNELIWREFFIQILFHFPNVVSNSFKKKYDNILWRNNEAEFERWKNGMTGYPIVDAGMRQLNQTGYMHNRVRMIVASFLCKHLLIDWRWGEAYFAEKLLDYELASNNGNWQWAAGTGCDAAPYFRVFNPYEQVKKFDDKLEYINTWIPELNSLNYPSPVVEHKFARERAIQTYKIGIEN